jgi:hypothetical protein
MTHLEETGHIKFLTERFITSGCTHLAYLFALRYKVEIVLLIYCDL